MPFSSADRAPPKFNRSPGSLLSCQLVEIAWWWYACIFEGGACVRVCVRMRVHVFVRVLMCVYVQGARRRRALTSPRAHWIGPESCGQEGSVWEDSPRDTPACSRLPVSERSCVCVCLSVPVSVPMGKCVYVSAGVVCENASMKILH